MEEILKTIKLCDNLPAKLKIKVLHVSTHSTRGDARAFICTEEDEVFARGSNQFGQLGLAHNQQVSEWTCLSALSGEHVQDFYTAPYCSFARTQEGNVWAMGWNGSELDTTRLSSSCSATRFLCGQHVVDIACGVQHYLALTSCGEVIAWGRNSWGQALTNTCSPLQIDGVVREFRAIACSDFGSLVVSRDGHVFAFGLNFFADLSPLVTQFNCWLKEAKVVKINDVVKVSCYNGNTYFLDSRGMVSALGHSYGSAIGACRVQHVFVDIHQMCFQSEDGHVFVLEGNNTCVETNYKNIFSYFLYEKQTTANSVQSRDNQIMTSSVRVSDVTQYNGDYSLEIEFKPLELK